MGVRDGGCVRRAGGDAIQFLAIGAQRLLTPRVGSAELKPQQRNGVHDSTPLAGRTERRILHGSQPMNGPVMSARPAERSRRRSAPARDGHISVPHLDRRLTIALALDPLDRANGGSR